MLEMAHNEQQTAAAHSLLTIPAELRLRIYEYLLPLDIPCGDLEGLVLSCRLVKEEMYYEMRKRVIDIQSTLEQRWPFDEVFTVIFPGRLFKAKDVIIDVPYLPEDTVFPFAEKDRAAWKWLESRNGFSLPVVRMTLHIGDIPGNPEFTIPRRLDYTAYHYMCELSLKYMVISGSRSEIEKERD